MLQDISSISPLFPAVSNKHTVSLLAASCASPFSHCRHELLIGLSLEKHHCAEATETGGSRMPSETVMFGNVSSRFYQERTAILTVCFVLIYITNYTENNRTQVHC
jgi:hypothetical protein